MKQVPPGGEAKITVKVSTKGYGGRKISETVSVITNDTTQPNLNVVLTGFVEKFAEITPQRVVISGSAGMPLTQQVKISAKKQFPFKINTVRAKDGTNIRFRLEEIPDSQNIVYLLTIDNIRQNPGRYTDIIYLDTDAAFYPVFQIYVNGDISKNSPITEIKP